MKSRIDLHLHTTCSDGSLSPEALVETAARRGVAVIAVTDHDSVAGIEPAQSAGERLGMTVLAGIEITCETEQEEVHLLGYGLDFRSAEFLRDLVMFRGARDDRNFRILAKLEELGCKLSPERVAEIANGETVGRPHIAAALVEAGYVQSAQEAFDRYIARGKPAFVPRHNVSPPEGVALLCRAGALVSLAHPAKMKDAGMIPQLVAAGLGALEVYHTDHRPADVTRFSQMAKRLGLLETGGTDSHGPESDRPTQVGAVAVPDSVWERLRPRLEARLNMQPAGRGIGS